MKKHTSFFPILSVLFIVLSSCQQSSIPKPYGYIRLTMPDTCYADAVPAGYPYRFDVSCNAEVGSVLNDQGGQYWIDLRYPALNATVHCS